MYTATLLCNSLQSFQIINNHIIVHTDLLRLILKVLIPWSSGDMGTGLNEDKSHPANITFKPSAWKDVFKYVENWGHYM